MAPAACHAIFFSPSPPVRCAGACPHRPGPARLPGPHRRHGDAPPRRGGTSRSVTGKTCRSPPAPLPAQPVRGRVPSRRNGQVKAGEGAGARGGFPFPAGSLEAGRDGEATCVPANPGTRVAAAAARARPGAPEPARSPARAGDARAPSMSASASATRTLHRSRGTAVHAGARTGGAGPGTRSRKRILPG